MRGRIIAACRNSEKASARQKAMPLWHRVGSAPSFPQEMAIAMLRHPMRTGEMAVMDIASAHGINVGIKVKQKLYDFPPVGPIGIGIEKP